MWVCLSVCLSVCSYVSKTTCPHFAAFSMRVTCGGRGLVFIRQQCNALCTSGFVDDVMFSHIGTNTDIEAWSMRRSELFTVTRQVAPGRSLISSTVSLPWFSVSPNHRQGPTWPLAGGSYRFEATGRYQVVKRWCEMSTWLRCASTSSSTRCSGAAASSARPPTWTCSSAGSTTSSTGSSPRCAWHSPSASASSC